MDAAGAYSPAVLDHFRRPRHAGSLSGRAATGEAGDADEGRLVRIQLRLGPDDSIGAARFKAFGCPATIACGSWVCEHVTGIGREAAERLRASAIVQALDLAPAHGAAADLVVDALREALREV